MIIKKYAILFLLLFVNLAFANAQSLEFIENKASIGLSELAERLIKTEK